MSGTGSGPILDALQKKTSYKTVIQMQACKFLMSNFRERIYSSKIFVTPNSQDAHYHPKIQCTELCKGLACVQITKRVTQVSNVLCKLCLLGLVVYSLQLEKIEEGDITTLYFPIFPHLLPWKGKGWRFLKSKEKLNWKKVPIIFGACRVGGDFTSKLVNLWLKYRYIDWYLIDG